MVIIIIYYYSIASAKFPLIFVEFSRQIREFLEKRLSERISVRTCGPIRRFGAMRKRRGRPIPPKCRERRRIGSAAALPVSGNGRTASGFPHLSAAQAALSGAAQAGRFSSGREQIAAQAAFHASSSDRENSC